MTMILIGSISSSGLPIKVEILFYAGRWKRIGLRQCRIHMHRLILGLDSRDTRLCDHKNGNGLDNRRANLRIATTSQNLANRGKTRRNTSGYKGVMWFKRKRKWYARIRVSGKSVHLGYFDDPIDAAKAYDDAALKHFGEFAKTNF